MVIAAGSVRVYFNRHGAAPFMWTVAPMVVGAAARPEPRCEIAVRDVLFSLVEVRTVYRRKETSDDEDGRPSGWLETFGEVEILANGVAVIRTGQAPP